LSYRLLIWNAFAIASFASLRRFDTSPSDWQLARWRSLRTRSQWAMVKDGGSVQLCFEGEHIEVHIGRNRWSSSPYCMLVVSGVSACASSFASGKYMIAMLLPMFD